MITKLTEEQTAKVPEYRERYFRQAISTEPADRERAETATRRLVEIAGYEIGSVAWLNDPYKCSSVIGPPERTLHNSLWNSLRDSLSAPLRVSLWNSPWDSLWNSLWNSLSASFSASLRNSLWDSLWSSLGDSLRNSLRDSLRGSPRNSLWNSLWESLWGPLSVSLWNSLSGTDWVCLNTFAVKELGLEIGDGHREVLHQYNEIAASCFAVWVAPGRAIFCERPASVEIKDGNLVGLNWRKRN